MVLCWHWLIQSKNFSAKNVTGKRGRGNSQVTARKREIGSRQMKHMGRQLTSGNFIKLDDLQSQFDGSKTTRNNWWLSFKAGTENVHSWYH